MRRSLWRCSMWMLAASESGSSGADKPIFYRLSLVVFILFCEGLWAENCWGSLGRNSDKACLSEFSKPHVDPSAFASELAK